MSAPPYMKLYVADYLGDTHHLGVVEHGAYLLLLMAMWRAGGALPATDANLAKLARCTPDQWAEIRDVVLPYFKRSRGRLTHKRLSEELAKYETTSGKRSEAGKRGGAKKASENKIGLKAIASVEESNCSHNQNQNQNQNSSEDKSSGAQGAVLSVDPDKATWDLALQVLTEQGNMPDRQARSFFAGLLKEHGLTAKELLPAVGGALSIQTREPRSYLVKAAAGISKRRAESRVPTRQGFV